nr:hypothetical protein [Tanacetum cinerariifolium]
AARRQTTIVVAVGRRYSHHSCTLWCRAVMAQPLGVSHSVSVGNLDDDLSISSSLHNLTEDDSNELSAKTSLPKGGENGLPAAKPPSWWRSDDGTATTAAPCGVEL